MDLCLRSTYDCSHCHDGSQMQTTVRPPQAVEKSPFGPSILAWPVTGKFLHHLPAYQRQELLLGPLKQWLSRALLCRLLSRTAQALRLLERLIHERVSASIVINADETEVKILKPGTAKRSRDISAVTHLMHNIGTCSMTSGPAAAATALGKCRPIIAVVFKQTASSSTPRLWARQREEESREAQARRRKRAARRLAATQ